MLVFRDSEMRYPLDFRSRVRCSWKRCRGVIVFETDFAFYVAQSGNAVFSVFENNQGAIQLAQNLVTNSNSKHIGVRHHFLRILVRQ